MEERKKKKGIVVIGSGYWGKNHVRNFYELGRLFGVCDTNESVLESIKNRYPEIVVNSDLDFFLKKNEKVGGFVVATPAKTHFKIAKKIIETGFSVLIEKPPALTLSEIEELILLSEIKKVKVMVGHLLLYHPAFVKAKSIIKSGKIGEVVHISSKRLNFGRVRTEENVLWSFAPHDISMIIELFEKKPVKIFDQSTNICSENLADRAEILLDFGDNKHGFVEVSWFYPEKIHELVTTGTQGFLVFKDNAKQNPLRFVKTEGKSKNVKIIEEKIVEVENQEPLKLECLDFLGAIDQEKNPISSLKRSYPVYEVLTKIEGSNSSSEQTVTTEPDFFVHKTAVIDENVSIGKKTKIWHFTHIMKNAVIGEQCVIGQNCFVGKGVKIGNSVKIQNNVSVYEGVLIEDEVFVGPSVVFTNVINPRAFIERKNEFRKTVVKRGATIGANSTIVCGVTIGEFAFVGAHSVVTKDIPPHALVYGNPAKIHGYVCRCGVKLDENFVCPSCGFKLQTPLNRA